MDTPGQYDFENFAKLFSILKCRFKDQDNPDLAAFVYIAALVPSYVPSDVLKFHVEFNQKAVLDETIKQQAKW